MNIFKKDFIFLLLDLHILFELALIMGCKSLLKVKYIELLILKFKININLERMFCFNHLLSCCFVYTEHVMNDGFIQIFLKTPKNQ